MKQSAIYKIESRIKPDKCYIGSTIDVYKRWHKHISELQFNRHHSRILQNHYNKYGKDDLIFIILEPCFPEFLTVREQYYINKLNPYFNVLDIAGSPLGVKRSIETKAKISLANRLREHKPHSEETKLKMRIASKNRVNKTGFKKGNKSHTEGKHLSDETKNKIRNKLIGINYNTFPESHRLKLSEGAKKMWAKRKNKNYETPEPW